MEPLSRKANKVIPNYDNMLNLKIKIIRNNIKCKNGYIILIYRVFNYSIRHYYG